MSDIVKREFTTLPSELPRVDGFDAEHIYIIDLDQEILTMNYSIHWKLRTIPRQDKMWLHAIADSIYWNKPTICLDICPEEEEHIALPALELREPNWAVEHDCCVVTQASQSRRQTWQPASPWTVEKGL